MIGDAARATGRGGDAARATGRGGDAARATGRGVTGRRALRTEWPVYTELIAAFDVMVGETLKAKGLGD